MTNFISGRELLGRWNIKEFELFDHVKNGLQPYNEIGLPLPPPDISSKLSRLEELEKKVSSLEHRYDGFKSLKAINVTRDGKRIYYSDGSDSLDRQNYQNLKKEVEKLEREIAEIENLNSWGDFALPESDINRARWIINLLQWAYFNLLDIKEIEKGLTRPNPEEPEDGPHEERTIPEVKAPLEENYFHRNGAFWEVGFNRESGIFPDWKGIRYVSQLLTTPGQRIPAIIITAKTPVETLREHFAESEGLSIKIKEHGKKAQSTVRKSINSFIEKLKEKGMGTLAEHLKENILPGGTYDFQYQDKTTQWSIRE